MFRTLTALLFACLLSPVMADQRAETQQQLDAAQKDVAELKKLLEARQHLANLQRYMNSKPKAQDQIRKLLNDPELMAALADSDKTATPEKDS